MGTLGDISFHLRYNGTMLCSDPVCSDWSHPCWFMSHITHLGVLDSTLTGGMVAGQAQAAREEQFS